MAGDPEAHGQLAAALAAAPIFLAGRERTKTNIIRLVNEIRVGQRALGNRMVERGLWAKPTSGAMLEDGEIDQFLADPEPWVDTIRERGGAVRAALRDRAAVRVRGVGAAAAHLGPSATAAPAWPRRARS